MFDRQGEITPPCAIPPRFVLAAASAPGRVEVPHRARIIGQPAIQIAGVLSRGREWDISGFQATRPVPLPRSRILGDSHIPTLVSKPKAFDTVDEAIEAAGHGLGAWWLIVAIPAAEPCSDP